MQHTKLRRRVDALEVPGYRRPAIKHGDVVTAAIGLLCLGKSDFNDIEAFREDRFFRLALGLRAIPSEPTLRQRLDAMPDACGTIFREESARMIRRFAGRITPCYGEWVALDVDVSPFDNSGTKKEGVSCTYKKVEGFAPIFAYLGEEGYLVDCQLREGKQHCQAGTPQFLDRALGYAATITRAKLLVRMDAGNDDLENLRICRKHKADWIIKRNLRRESPEDWLAEANLYGKREMPREGKEVYTGVTWHERDGKRYRVVFEVIYRTIAADGQRLLIPDIEVNTWWTSLRLPAEEVIALYHAHGTSEQFHSELKSDMDLERLPSGKFATNAMMLSLALVAYNVLRLCGQQGLKEQRLLPTAEQAPLKKVARQVFRRSPSRSRSTVSTGRARRKKKKVSGPGRVVATSASAASTERSPMEKKRPKKSFFRRRLRSVMQDLIYLAAKLTRHASRWRLLLWQNSPWHAVWQGVYERFCTAPGARSG